MPIRVFVLVLLLLPNLVIVMEVLMVMDMNTVSLLGLPQGEDGECVIPKSVETKDVPVSMVVLHCAIVISGFRGGHVAS